MAKAISKIKRMELSVAEVRARRVDRLQQQIADSGDSLHKAIELIQALDKAELLDMLTALVKHKDDALANVVREMNKDRYTSVLENASGFMFLLGELDVHHVRSITTRINQGLDYAHKAVEQEEKTSYLDLMRALKDPEINQGVTMMLHFLKGLGANQK